MLVDCPCGATCRIPKILKTKLRCGKCKHVFTPRELTKARPEPRPAPPPEWDGSDGEDDFELGPEDDEIW